MSKQYYLLTCPKCGKAKSALVTHRQTIKSGQVYDSWKVEKCTACKKSLGLREVMTHTPTVEIVNGPMCYILKIEGQEIPFSYGSNAEYFEDLFKRLGFHVTVTNNYETADV